MKNTSHGNEMLPQDITHLIQRPCYKRGSPCQDPAGNWTTRRPLDDRKETQTAMVWSCLPFVRSGQNHLARHSERGEKARQTEAEVGRQHQEMDRPGVRKVPESSGKQGEMEESGCEIICVAPMTLVVRGLMMMSNTFTPTHAHTHAHAHTHTHTHTHILTYTYTHTHTHTHTPLIDHSWKRLTGEKQFWKRWVLRAVLNDEEESEWQPDRGRLSRKMGWHKRMIFRQTVLCLHEGW